MQRASHKTQATPLSLRCKIRSYLSQIFSGNFTDFRQLVRAISRLYRSRFLQPNTHFFKHFARSTRFAHLRAARNSKSSQKFVKLFSHFFSNFCKNPFFRQFSSNFAQMLMKFSRNFAKFRIECWEFVKFLDFLESKWKKTDRTEKPLTPPKKPKMMENNEELLHNNRSAKFHDHEK